jgi:hypothetical protein
MSNPIDELLRRVRGAAQVTCRCSHCDFVIVASLEQARAAFEAHRCSRPKPTTSKRGRTGFSTIRR